MLTADSFFTSWQPFGAGVLGALAFILLLSVWRSAAVLGGRIEQAVPDFMKARHRSRLTLASDFWGAVFVLYFLQMWLFVEHKCTMSDGMWAAFVVSLCINAYPFVLSLLATFTLPPLAKYHLLEGGGKVLAFTVCGGLIGLYL